MRSSKKENADYQSTNQLETGENKPVFGSWNSPLETEKLTKPIEKIGHFIFDLGDLAAKMRNFGHSISVLGDPAPNKMFVNF